MASNKRIDAYNAGYRAAERGHTGEEERYLRYRTGNPEAFAEGMADHAKENAPSEPLVTPDGPLKVRAVNAGRMSGGYYQADLEINGEIVGHIERGQSQGGRRANEYRVKIGSLTMTEGPRLDVALRELRDPEMRQDLIDALDERESGRVRRGFGDDPVRTEGVEGERRGRGSRSALRPASGRTSGTRRPSAQPTARSCSTTAPPRRARCRSRRRGGCGRTT